MRPATILRLRLRSLFRRAAVEEELDEELRYHADRQMEVYLAQGMNPRAARDAAYQAMHGIEIRKEECRDMRGLNLLENLSHDIRFALRQLEKNAGFASTAILILALGICASLSIFAFVDAALLKPLPYREPTRLMAVFESIALFPQSNLSYPDYLDWKKLNTVFESLDIYQRTGWSLNSAKGVEPVRGVRVSAGFFRTLGIVPALGRDFDFGEGGSSPARSLLLTYGSWQARFGGRRDVLGQTVVLDREPFVVAGVLPREFHFAPAGNAEFWIPFHASRSCDLRRSCHGLYGVGRLKAGVSESAALSNLTAIARQLERQYPDSNRGQGAAIAPLAEVISGYIRPLLLLLLAGAGLLLLIANINVMGLLLVRSESRRREIAVRAALGASSGRLMTQFVTEAVVLAAAGTALGLLGAQWTMRLLMSLISDDMMAGMPFLAGLGLTPRVAGAGVSVALLAVVMCSLAPGWRLWRPAVRDGLSEGSRGSAGLVWRRLGSKLVVLELAAAMVLLVGAGLLGKSLYLLLNVEVGLQPEQLVTLDMASPSSVYANDDQRIALARKLVNRVESLPGVVSVGLSSNGVPLGGNGNTTWLRVLGRPWHGEHNEMPERVVNPAYFTALGARLLEGRYFTADDDSAKPRVAIVNRAFVRQYFPHEKALGRQLSHLSTPPVAIEIVGIVEDIRQGPLDAPIPPVLYTPFHQNSDNYFSLIVRTSQSEGALLPVLAAVAKQIDPDIITMGGATMKERINNSPSAYLHRSSAALVAGFALLALVLGLVGLYGVVAYSVSQRTREIGVRMALGAQTGSVYRLILSEAGWLTCFGLALGVALSIGAATLMRSLLFGVSSWDIPTLLLVAAGLGGAAILASYIPARRAASINPVEALRAE